ISPENPPQNMASNPNQKNTQKQKTGIKTKNKHTIEFTNNTPTSPNQTHQNQQEKPRKKATTTAPRPRRQEKNLHTHHPPRQTKTT
ncbi:hypothetical protein, partial [Actinomyces marseillensis]|uniref:hypothetical protein n=1 Tax=Actinomyces marseillensis TaxID=1852376 RepID=UPI001F1684D7